MHARHRGGLPFIHLHLLVFADADTERFQAQITTVSTAAGSEEHRIEHTVDRAVMAERTNAFAIALQFAQAIAEMNPYALLLQVLGQLVGQLVVEALQQALAAHQQAHLAAQCLQQSGQLHCNVTATDDRHLGWCRTQVEEIIGNQAQLRAGNVGPQRVRAGGDQDVLGAVTHAIAAGHGVRIEQMAARGNAHHAGFIQALVVAGVDVADVCLAMDHQFLPRQRRACLDIEAHRTGQADALVQVGRQPHRLLRHAADIDTGAAQFAGLQQRHALAVLRGPDRASQAGGAAAKDDQVVIIGCCAHRNRSGR